MNPERVAFYIFAIPLFIALLLFRKRIFYLWAPTKIVSYKERKTLGALHFLFTIVLALVLHFAVNYFSDVDEKLNEHNFFRIMIVLSELIISGSLIGMLIDKYLMATNSGFRDWRKQKDKRDKIN